ncbi:hypothetical protein G6F59_016956 [Rhizopus arrhizus]|nr:hypothetical protein G6F59_016956 [Rhizopus arrhizus]
MERLFADAVAAVGRPDIAINTVGKVLKKPLLEISEAERLVATSMMAVASALWARRCWVRAHRAIPAMPGPRRRWNTSPAQRRRNSASAASR